MICPEIAAIPEVNKTKLQILPYNKIKIKIEYF